MNRSILYFTLVGLAIAGCQCSPEQLENTTDTEMETTENDTIFQSVEINASISRVWEVITQPEYAKKLGNEFDKNAYLESDWKDGSIVYFKNEPDSIVSEGTISELIEEQLIQLDYNFAGFLYTETYKLKKENNNSVLSIIAGPYGSDYNAHYTVWTKWLQKVKELSESKIKK